MDILSLHLTDEYTQISDYCKDTIIYLTSNNNLSDFNKYHMFDLLKENMYQSLTSLPRIVRGIIPELPLSKILLGNNETESLLALKLIIGYVTIIGHSEEQMSLLIDTSLPRISIALFQILNFDISDIRYVII